MYKKLADTYVKINIGHLSSILFEEPKLASWQMLAISVAEAHARHSELCWFLSSLGVKSVASRGLMPFLLCTGGQRVTIRIYLYGAVFLTKKKRG
jgi:hypothetical protein